MNVAIEEISSCRKRLKIEVPANRVNEALQKVTRDFQKIAQIQGFRPGKAPITLVEKRYSKDIEDEVKRTLVPTVYREAVQEKHLKVVSSPQIEDFHFTRGNSLSFSTLVDLEPEFAIPEYKGLKLKKGDTSVTEEDYQKVIGRILDQEADYKIITDRAVQEGDFAIISYTGAIEGKPIKEVLPAATTLGEQKGFWLLIKEDTFLPGFGQQLVGAKTGESREVKVTFKDDFPEESLRGKEAVYQVTVDEIKEKVLPELNDELSQKIAKINKDELEKTIRENLGKEKERQAQSDHVKQIVDHITENLKFELPESTVQEETQRFIYDIVRENQMRGIPTDLLEEKKEDIFNAAQTSAKDKVKIGFILGKIADAEKIEATGQDIVGEVQLMAQRSNTPVQKLFDKLRENGGLESLRSEIRNRKAIDFILQSAIIE